MWRCGSVPPLVNLLRDHGAAERAALLPVKPQSDAFITEYVLHSRKNNSMSACPTLIYRTDLIQENIRGSDKINIIPKEKQGLLFQ